MTKRSRASVSAIGPNPHPVYDPVMEYTSLGRTDLRVSRVVFGAMARGARDGGMREGLVRRALDLGITTIDTAPLYELGDSERWVGRAVAGRRDEALICTKVGLRWDEDSCGETLLNLTTAEGEPVSVRRDSRPASVRKDVEESLRRLSIDHLDLVQIHHRDPDTPVEETMGALLDLRNEGKLRHIGVSNYSRADSERAAQALGDVPLAVLQLPYSLLERRIEPELLPWARNNRVGVFAYSPLAEGILAGKYLRRWPTVMSYEALHHPRNAWPLTFRVKRVLEPRAKEHGVSIASVALAWVLSQRGITAPIVGASTEAHLEAAAAAFEVGLTQVDLKAMENAFAEARIDPSAGHRRRDRALRWPLKLARRGRAVVRRFGL